MEQQGFGGDKIAYQKCNFLHSYIFLYSLLKKKPTNINKIGFEKRMTRDLKNQIKIV